MLVLWLIMLLLLLLWLLLMLMLLLMLQLGSVLLFGLLVLSDLLWLWCWDLYNDIGWFTDDFSFETFFWISSILDGPNETIRVYHGVTAFNNLSFSCFLAVLIIGVFIVFNIESKLI